MIYVFFFFFWELDSTMYGGTFRLKVKSRRIFFYEIVEISMRLFLTTCYMTIIFKQ
jgi:hypothetical protein